MTELAEDTRPLASPLTLLLEEEQHGDRQAEEILILSFTGDLGFFESFALGPAHACGARVTFVSDVAVSTYDPRAVRRAGRSYLAGHASCRGAFHPKVVIVAGPMRVTAAIGSGNATLAGWQANAELWTVLRGDTASCPPALADLARWLRSLPGNIGFSWGVPEALDRTAAALEELLDVAAQRSQPGTWVVSTSQGPIIDQLPAGPVDELAVCAPFHDPGAAALRALCQKMQPRRLLVSIQPGLASYDGPALAALAAGHDGELTFDEEASRYRHGKLIEWAADGQRHALTGSPNLSGAALLRGLDSGGNCEIGLITPIPETLLPPGTAAPATAIQSGRLRIQPRPRDTALLLGAARTEQGLHVLFTRPLPAAGYLELSHAAAPPEVWERAADVPAVSTDADVTIAADGGSRLRLVIPSQDGALSYSNIIPVVDPLRAVRRPGITTAHAPATRPDDLFADPALAERFLADLSALRTELPPAPTPAASGASAHGATQPADRSQGSWERYLDECAGRIGHPLLRFALGIPLPDIAGLEDATMLRPSWDEQFADDQETGLEDDSAEDYADEQAAEPAPVQVPAPPDLRAAGERRPGAATAGGPSG